MSVLTAVILGLVQGIAEFLPISSSGHLAIAEHLLNMQGASNVPNFFDVLLHLGTLVAVFAAYWDDIRDMIVEFFTGRIEIASAAPSVGSVPAPSSSKRTSERSSTFLRKETILVI